MFPIFAVNKIEIMEKGIKISLEQAKELLKTTPLLTDVIYENFPELKPKKRWFEEYGFGNFRIAGNLNTGLFECGNLFILLGHKNSTTFKTKEQAEQHAKRLNLYTEMQVFANFRNGDWVVDSKDGTQNKYGITLNRTSVYVCGTNGCHNYFIFQIVVKSEEIAEEMLEEFGERIAECFD